MKNLSWLILSVLFFTGINIKTQYFSRCIVGYPSWIFPTYAGLWAKEKHLIIQQQDKVPFKVIERKKRER